MAHLDDGTVQALLHQELSTERRADAERHLAECPACEAAVQHARSEDDWILGRLAVLEDGRSSAEPPAWRPTVARASRGVLWRRAAGLLVLLGGSGALWALPAVRSWVLRAVAREEPPPAASPTVADGRETSPRATAPSGLSIVPGTRFVIEMPEGAWGVRLRLDDRPDLSIVADSGRATFESAEDWVRVRPDRGASIRVDVPRDAASVEVVIDGRRVLRVRAGTVTTAAPLDADGWYQVLPRASGSPSADVP